MGLNLRGQTGGSHVLVSRGPVDLASRNRLRPFFHSLSPIIFSFFLFLPVMGFLLTIYDH